jgi:hypothetical protein
MARTKLKRLEGEGSSVSLLGVSCNVQVHRDRIKGLMDGEGLVFEKSEMQMPTENGSRAVVIRVAQQQERPASRPTPFPDLLPKTDHFQGPLCV